MLDNSNKSDKKHIESKDGSIKSKETINEN